MWQRLVLFLFIANIMRFTSELGINQMDFCCSNTCCCSVCTAEQCQLPDQPGNFIYKPEPIEIPDKMQIFPVLPGQSVMAQLVPLGTITELDIDPLCCAVGNCPTWIKCKHPLNVKRDQSGIHRSSKLEVLFMNE
uniref:DUF4773 domain-containing protein n=1 Tax=Loa loa TaxID=7209 RepID=A0A1I7VSD4_LOALO